MYTHVLMTRNVRRAPFMIALTLSNNGSRLDFRHLYFRGFKLFLLHSIDTLSGFTLQMYQKMITKTPQNTIYCDENIPMLS